MQEARSFQICSDADAYPLGVRQQASQPLATQVGRLHFGVR